MKTTLYLLAIIVLLQSCGGDANWNQYLGPDRNATVKGTSILTSWGEKGPRELWSFQLGEGYGGASIYGNEVFILDRQKGESDILRCIDLDSGEEIWSFAYDASGELPYPGSRAVLTVDRNYVWSVGPQGHFYCFDRKTRQPAWSHNLQKDFNIEPSKWGISQSPLVYENIVIVAPDGEKAGLAAYNKFTGEPVWQTRPLTGHSFHVSPTRWRGPEGNGIYPDRGLMSEWPAGGPEILWSYEQLGQGHSSPVIAGEELYSTGMIDSTGYLFRFDLDGNLVYRRKYGPEYTQSYHGPRGSPVIDGDRIYVVSGYGRLYCLSRTNGRLIWRVDMVNKYGGRIPRWGYNETVTIDGRWVYCTPGGGRHNVVALNKFDGSLIWMSPGKGGASAYCSPLLFTHEGKKILATHSDGHFMGIDPGNGRVLWTFPHPNEWSVHPNTPIYHDGGLLFFSGYGKGSAKLELKDDGSKASIAWKNGSFDSRMGGAVLLNGYLYGSGDRNRSWKCLDWETGDTTWTSTAIAKGNVIYADGNLYCYTEKGELALVKPDPGNFDLVSLTRVTIGSGQHWAHPMIHRGVLYLRHGNALIAYKIK